MHRVAALVFLPLFATMARSDEPEIPSKQALRLPGVRADGSVQLPNTWFIRPAGMQVELGDFPVNLALHPDHRWLACLHAGYREHEIHVLDLEPTKPRIRSRVALPQAFYGLAFAPDGKALYASGG